MSNNCNPYRNQNMSPNMRSANMRGGYVYPTSGQGQRAMTNDCGCGATPVQQRTMTGDCGCGATPVQQRTVTGDCGCGATPVQQRTVTGDCGCGATPAYTRDVQIPTGDRKSLLAYIDQVSFAAYEAALYLDTHPDCPSGLQYFREHNDKRNLALQEYAKLYGPLDLTQAGESCEAYWQWANQPLPWEGGNC